MPGPANDLNINQSGFVNFDGVATFSGRTLTAGTGVTIANGNGVLANPIISSTGSVPLQVTGNSGIAVPSANNLNVVTANSTPKFVGSGSTLTLDFGLTNLMLGSDSTAITTASGNVGVGFAALDIVTSGASNCSIGYGSMSSLTTGNNNVAVGAGALVSANSSGDTAIGDSAISGNSGGNNTAVGKATLTSLGGVGLNNAVFGAGSGNAYTGSESSNLLLLNAGVLGESNTIRIGTNGSGVGQQNRSFMAGITSVTVASSAPVGINSSGQLSSLGFGTSGLVFTSNGAGASATFQAVAASSLITTYNAGGLWSINSRAKTVRFLAWGGGGGAGSGRCGSASNSGGGGGGAAGGFYDMVFNASDLTGSPYTVTVGTGGTGGTSINATTTNGNPGNPGTNTTVGSFVLAVGGLGGVGGTTASANGGGSSFVTFSGLSTQASAGTAGTNAVAGSGTNLTNSFGGGGGGGSGYLVATPRIGGAAGSILDQAANVLVAGGLAGANTGATAGNGNAPSVQTLSIGATGGGGGGHDGVTTAGTGGNGAQPGGGGGGGAGNLSLNASGAGGNGGNGKVIVIEYF